MSSNTTSSIYGSGVNSKRISGLMSGLDTEDLVKQMSQGTQIKINRQFQAQQKLVYKQDAFRDVISKLVKFSDNYLSFTSKTNILSKNFFRSDTFKSSNDSIKVSGDPNAIKNFVINSVDSVATNARFTSTRRISDTTFESKVIESNMDVSTLASQSMAIQYGSNSYTLTISSNLDPNATLSDVLADLNGKITEINDKITDESKKLNINFTEVGGTVQLENNGTGDMKITSVGSAIEGALKLKAQGKNDPATGAGGTIVASEIADSTKFKVNEQLSDILKAGYITFDYNGSIKTVKFPTDQDITNATDLVAHLNKELNKLYGTGKISVSEEGGKIRFDAGNGNNLFGISSIDRKVSKHLGIEPSTYNRINKNKSIAEAGLKLDGVDELGNPISLKVATEGEHVGKYTMKINNKILAFDESSTLNDIISKINNDSDLGIKITHSSTTDTFTVMSTNTGAHTKVDISDVNGSNLASLLFGTSGTQAEVEAGTADYVINEGKDAKIRYTINGGEEQILERSTNSFNVDGVNIELTNASKGAEKVSFTVSNDTDKIVENMAKFISDYNEIVSYLDEKLREAPNKKYPPLTDEQRKELTESEAKLWDEKAKEGMLFSDKNIYNALYSMRNAMSDMVEGAGLSLPNIGIDYARGDYSGKFVFDENKFREAYAKNPETIEKLFTQSVENGTKLQQGIAYKLKDVISKNVGTRGEKGTLVEYSGTKNTSTEKENFLSDRIKEYQETIDNLKTKIEVERQRYWKQFTALEKALSNMNSQSAWLSSQFQ